MNNYVIEKTLKLYTDVGWKRWFSKIRFWDAPYIETERLVPDNGRILELGCGEGIFSNFLAISSPKRKIIGVDIDAKRIVDADRGLKNTKFLKGDATKMKIGNFDTIVMVHLLHHLLSCESQEKLIKSASKLIKKGKKLIIVEVDTKPFFKYLVSWFVDHFVVAWLFERKLYEVNIYYRSQDSWIKLLGDSGFECKVVSAHKGKPFSHIIFECTKT